MSLLSEYMKKEQLLKQLSDELKQLEGEGRVPVIVGGTGLYFKALTEGLAAMPPVAPEIRAKWRQALDDEGAAALHAQLAALEGHDFHLVGRAAIDFAAQGGVELRVELCQLVESGRHP